MPCLVSSPKRIYGEPIRPKQPLTLEQEILIERYNKAKSAYQRACAIAQKTPEKNFYLNREIKLDDYTQAQLDFELMKLLENGIEVNPPPAHEKIKPRVWNFHNGLLKVYGF